LKHKVFKFQGLSDAITVKVDSEIDEEDLIWSGLSMKKMDDGMMTLYLAV